MMPRDTNPYGTIFGGVVLSYIDQAGAVGAQHEIRRAGWPDPPIVTVGMKTVEFHRPVFVGDTVSFWTSVVRVEQTSITMHVTVGADRHGERLHTHGDGRKGEGRGVDPGAGDHSAKWRGIERSQQVTATREAMP